MLLHGDVGRLESVSALQVADDLMVFRDGYLYRVNTDALDNFVSALKFVTVTTSPFTVTDEDMIFANPDTLGADITINLPTTASRASGGYTRPVTVKHVGATSDHDVILDASGSEEIDGAATNVISIQEDSIDVASDGIGWNII